MSQGILSASIMPRPSALEGVESQCPINILIFKLLHCSDIRGQLQGSVTRQTHQHPCLQGHNQERRRIRQPSI